MTLLKATRPRRCCPGYQAHRSHMVFADFYPTNNGRLQETARRPSRPCACPTRPSRIRTGDLRRLGLRLPVRLPGTPAHGDRPTAPRTRARHGHDPDRAHGHLPHRAARTAPWRKSTHRVSSPRRTSSKRLLEPIARVNDAACRRSTSAPMMQITKRPPRHLHPPGVPVHDPRSARLRHPAGGDHLRLLRQAEVGHPRLRHVELRGDGLQGRRPRQAEASW